MAHIKLFIGFTVFITVISPQLSLPLLNIGQYFKERRDLIKQFKNDAIGMNSTLTAEEQVVNNRLISWKKQEFEEGVKNPMEFWAAQHFFRAKPHIENSKIFQFIQKLPKGASLHSHDTALVSDDYVFNITYRENLYATEDSVGKISLLFASQPPGTEWKPISELRNNNDTFNQRLRQQMTLIRDNPEVAYADTNSAWRVFQNIFSTITPLLTYKPVFKDYFYQALKELYEDNVRYLEFRGTLPDLYDLDNNTYGPEEVLKVYYETSQKFMKDYPEFWGVKFIFAPNRNTNYVLLEEYFNFLTKMKQKFPTFLAGFDLVGQEDTGSPLKNFIPALLKLKKITNFFFHAGETLWNGVRVDENLIDAILLNTTRIGHAYAIFKHPEILRVVKERNIALEICPISNQVLGLVKDLRNHPANYLIANDYPVVIAPDDPSFWGAKGVSYDWYMAFMGMSSRVTDLRLLKQLALNSIIYSSMEEDLKEKVLKKWESEWEQFLKDVIQELI